MTKEEVAKVIACCDENNREALRELLPDKWSKQNNQNQLDTTWANLGKLPLN